MYTDWHPPVFAALWRLVNTVWNGITGMQATGSGVLFTLHVLMLWGGMGLLVRAGEGFFTCFTGTARWKFCLPLGLLIFLCLFKILPISTRFFKDPAMMASYVFAVGILFNFPEKPVFKVIAGALCILALFYGTAVRHNAVFAVAPLLFLLAAKLCPQLRLGKLLLTSLLLLGTLLLSIHYVNYTFLDMKKQNSVQEVFYADMWRLNYITNTFDLPPHVDRGGLNILTKDIFFRFYDEKPTLATRSFKYSNAYYHDSPIEVVQLRNAYTTDDILLLYKAWIQKITKHPWQYIIILHKIFKEMLGKYYFMGFSGISYYIVVFIAIGILIWKSVKKYAIRNIAPYCVIFSGLLYVLPYMVFVMDVQRRFLYWFFFASFLGITWIAGIALKKWLRGVENGFENEVGA